MKHSHKQLLIGLAVVAALAGTAVASTYIAREPEPMQQARVVHSAPQPVVAQNQAKPPCDDHNIVGTVGGAVAGGLIGSQIGSGSGKAAATAVGVVGGGALGNAMIPTRGVTCD